LKRSLDRNDNSGVIQSAGAAPPFPAHACLPHLKLGFSAYALHTTDQHTRHAAFGRLVFPLVMWTQASGLMNDVDSFGAGLSSGSDVVGTRTTVGVAGGCQSARAASTADASAVPRAATRVGIRYPGALSFLRAHGTVFCTTCHRCGCRCGNVGCWFVVLPLRFSSVISSRTLPPHTCHCWVLPHVRILRTRTAQRAHCRAAFTARLLPLRVLPRCHAAHTPHTHLRDKSWTVVVGWDGL